MPSRSARPGHRGRVEEHTVAGAAVHCAPADTRACAVCWRPREGDLVLNQPTAGHFSDHERGNHPAAPRRGPGHARRITHRHLNATERELSQLTGPYGCCKRRQSGANPLPAGRPRRTTRVSRTSTPTNGETAEQRRRDRADVVDRKGADGVCAGCSAAGSHGDARRVGERRAPYPRPPLARGKRRGPRVLRHHGPVSLRTIEFFAVFADVDAGEGSR